MSPLPATALAPGPATNRALDPSLESGLASAQVSNNAAQYPITAVTDVVFTGAKAWRSDRTTSGLNNVIGSTVLSAAPDTAVTKIPASQGEVVSCSAMLRCSIAANARLSVVMRDATTILGTLNGPLTPIPANTWVLVKFENATINQPVNHISHNGIITTLAGNVVGGEQGWYDALMVNTGPTVEPYFDGSKLGCRWLGSPHQSQSRRPGPFRLWDGSAEQDLTPDQAYASVEIV